MPDLKYWRFRKAADVAPWTGTTRSGASRQVGEAGQFWLLCIGASAVFDRPTIFCKSGSRHGEWAAWFSGYMDNPAVGDAPPVAVRRLLENERPASYLLLCDADPAGSRTLRLEIEWKPPELLFPCLACDGRGYSAGMPDDTACYSCGGRKVVPV